MQRLKGPAVKNMSEEQLRGCVTLGEEIADGKADLVELDERSLKCRGKVKRGGRGEGGKEGGSEKGGSGGRGVKRKKGDDDGDDDGQEVEAQKRIKDHGHSNGVDSSNNKKSNGHETPKPSSKASPTVKTATHKSGHNRQTTLRAPTPPAPPAPIPADIRSRITSCPTLTPFRQRVLLALCQVPSGHYTTYAAISEHLSSSPRAVGNALRNNPFAPQVPCHRVVASDGGIGGFGGDWGKEGKHVGEKWRLLRGEGVRVREGEGKVEGRRWANFQKEDDDHDDHDDNDGLGGKEEGGEG